MIELNDKSRTALEYMGYLSEQFGLDPNYRPQVEQHTMDLWSTWESQGVSKPSDLSDAIHRPEILNKQYFDDILTANKLIINDAYFFIFPWFEFNAAANTLETDEHVILFDSSLIAFLNSVTIPITVWAYGQLSETESDFYERFIIERFEEFIFRKGCSSLNDKQRERFAEDFKTICGRDYDLTFAGANCAIAMNCFILCHEIAHIALTHCKQGKRILNVMNTENSPLAEINSISRQQEFEADQYGFDLFSNLVKNGESAKMVKLTETYQLMPLAFFEIIDLVYCYAKTKGVNYSSSNTHPDPSERKAHLIDKLETTIIDENDFYGAYMAFSKAMRQRIS